MISRLLGLLLALMMAIAPPSGLVVCLDADGCVAAELGQGDGSCSPCDEHALHAAGREIGATNLLLRGSDLPCVDIGLLPFASESTTKRTAAESQPRVEYVAVLADSPPVPEPPPMRASEANILPPAPGPNGALRHLRSTILVI